MSEITKLYENANIKAKEYCDRDSDACMSCCPEWDNRQDCWKYKSVIPPFTAEKQIELIKFLMEDYSYYLYAIDTDNFENGLAASLNDLWHSLSEQEKQQVKGILE